MIKRKIVSLVFLLIMGVGMGTAQAFPPVDAPENLPGQETPLDPDLPLIIPFIVNGTLPILKSTETHFRISACLRRVDDALFRYYAAREQGYKPADLIQEKNEVYKTVGACVTLMDGYARHFQQDISDHLRDLHGIVRRYQNAARSEP